MQGKSAGLKIRLDRADFAQNFTEGFLASFRTGLAVTLYYDPQGESFGFASPQRLEAGAIELMELNAKASLPYVEDIAQIEEMLKVHREDLEGLVMDDVMMGWVESLGDRYYARVEDEKDAR